MVERLEELRLPTEILEGVPDQKRLDADHRAAFRDYGIDVDGLDLAEAADLIRTRRIRDQLTVALLTWARVRAHARPNDSADWRRLVEIARRADPDPLRQRMLDALLRLDLATLQSLAAEPRIARWPGPTLLILGSGLAFLGDFPAGLKLMRQAQQEHPDDFWITHTLAYFLYQKDPPELAEAIRLFTAAVALRPNSADVRNNFGKALARQGRLDEAVIAYRQAIHLEPRFAEPHANLGNAWRRMGRYDEALASCRRAIELRKDYPLAHFTLADVLRQQGRLDEAITAYHRALDLRPNNATAWKNLGIALRKKGRLSEARAAHRHALRLRPGFAEAYHNLGNVLADQGHLDEAIFAHRRAIQRRPGYAEAHCGLGRALMQQGQFAEALAALKRGHALGKKRPHWPYPSEEWIRACECWREVDAHVPGLLKSCSRPGGTLDQPFPFSKE
jgi:tetratricopeptide (TPR) repeat protein